MTDAQITIGQEMLRAELAELELRLVDRFTKALTGKADSAIITQMDARVQTLELSRAAREHLVHDLAELERRLVKLERLKNAIPSVSLLSFVVSVAVLAYYLIGAKP